MAAASLDRAAACEDRWGESRSDPELLFIKDRIIGVERSFSALRLTAWRPTALLGMLTSGIPPKPSEVPEGDGTLKAFLPVLLLFPTGKCGQRGTETTEIYHM